MKTTSLEHACPVGAAISVLSGRWRATIICALLHESPQRFMALQRSTCAKARFSLSRKVLAEELTALIELGLVERSQGPAINPPLEVYYALTPWGAELGTVMDALLVWARSQSGPHGNRDGARAPKRGSPAGAL